MSKPTLNVGSTGAFVKEAQTKLNLHRPSKFAPLVPDGQFGFLTDRRVKEFKSSKNLSGKSSQIDGKVWDELDQVATNQPPEIPVSTPPTKPPNQVGHRRKSIISKAASEKASVDYSRRVNSQPFGWEHLGEILSEGADLQVAESELRATWQPHGIKWCSIFCVYCYRHAGADARWGRFSGGKLFGNLSFHLPHEYPSHQEFIHSIRAADICILHGSESHHVLCTSIHPSGGMMKTMEGNLEWGRIDARTRRLDSIVAFYSLRTE